MADRDVYTGFWVNHDKDNVLGATLTVTNSQASYIIATLAFLLSTLLAGSIWRILVVVVYLSRSSAPAAGTFEHQQWTVMRNSDSSSAAILSLSTAILSWDKQRPWRIRLTLSLSLLSLAALIFPLAAVIIPPQVVTKVTDDIIVLSKERSCGFGTELNSEDNLVGRVSSVFARDLEETTTARTYARDWYDNDQDNGAIFKVKLHKGFVVEKLPYTETTSAKCPFAEEFCKTGSNGAIPFDTGLLNSHVHLGIDAPKDERVEYRWKSTCTPIEMNDHEPPLYKIISNATGNITDSWSVGALSEVRFGPRGGNSYTFMARRILDSTNNNAHFEIQSVFFVEEFRVELFQSI